MLEFVIEDDSPRVSSVDDVSSPSAPRRSLSWPFFPKVMMGGLSCRSFSYSKLPEEPLNLTIFKLDGSCFDIEVAKSASIADLKLAVQAVFDHFPNEISWPHVWAHFCLSYEGQKLLADFDYIKYFGIRDGDKLHFTRRVSICYDLTKKPTTKRTASSKHQYICRTLSRTSSRDLDWDQKSADDYDEMENGYGRYSNNKEVGGGWNSYAKLNSDERGGGWRDDDIVDDPSESACSFLFTFKKLLKIP